MLWGFYRFFHLKPCKINWLLTNVIYLIEASLKLSNLTRFHFFAFSSSVNLQRGFEERRGQVQRQSTHHSATAGVKAILFTVDFQDVRTVRSEFFLFRNPFKIVSIFRKPRMLQITMNLCQMDNTGTLWRTLDNIWLPLKGSRPPIWRTAGLDAKCYSIT